MTGWAHQHGQDGTLKLYRAAGCETCRGTGCKSRLGLHELLVADDTIRKLIQERARVADLFTGCITAGTHTQKMDDMEKALMGQTDLKQVRAACVR